MVPVLLLPAGGAPGARATHQRTLASVAAQTVECGVHETRPELAAGDAAYTALVLAGVELDATACERAAWFLATHAEVDGVTGAVVSTAAAAVPDPMASVPQFLMVRTALLQQILAGTDVFTASTGAAVALALRQRGGRGVGWISEPVIRRGADADVTVPIVAEIVSVLQSLRLPEDTLVDMRPSGIPVAPLQALARVTPPALTVRRTAARGMRVLALLQGFPMGGYTAFNADLLPRLAAAGHAVTTCTTEWWRTDWRLDRVTPSCPDIHHAHAAVPAAAVPAYIDWLITTRGIEVVLLSHSLLGFHLLPWLRARHPTVAFVDYVHTDWFEMGMYGSYAAMAMQWEGQLDAQLATSEALTAQLVAGGCAVDAVRTAPIGIDTTLWQHRGARHAAVRGSLGAVDTTLVLIFSGRLSPEKRPHLAVDVVAQLVAEGHDVLLVFAGSGQLIQSTHDRAQHLGIEARCKFLGEIDEPTLRAVYSACDVLIAPSEIEGISRSLYEAMAMGCVPVVSDVGGQRELVVPGTGALVPADRNEATKYVDGVRPYLDVAARQRASAAARAHVAGGFDTQRTVEIVCDTLALARARRRTRPADVPAAMAEQLVVLALELIRRHVLRAVSR